MDDTDTDDWISCAEAAKLTPSPTGKRTCTNTMIRLFRAGGLKYKKRGRWYFFRRADVLGLLESPPSKEPGGAIPVEPVPMSKATRETLKRARL